MSSTQGGASTPASSAHDPAKWHFYDDQWLPWQDCVAPPVLDRDTGRGVNCHLAYDTSVGEIFLCGAAGAYVSGGVARVSEALPVAPAADGINVLHLLAPPHQFRATALGSVAMISAPLPTHNSMHDTGARTPLSASAAIDNTFSQGPISALSRHIVMAENPALKEPEPTFGEPIPGLETMKLWGVDLNHRFGDSPRGSLPASGQLAVMPLLALSMDDHMGHRRPRVFPCQAPGAFLAAVPREQSSTLERCVLQEQMIGMGYAARESFVPTFPDPANDPFQPARQSRLRGLLREYDPYGYVGFLHHADGSTEVLLQTLQSPTQNATPPVDDVNGVGEPVVAGCLQSVRIPPIPESAFTFDPSQSFTPQPLPARFHCITEPWDHVVQCGVGSTIVACYKERPLFDVDPPSVRGIIRFLNLTTGRCIGGWRVPSPLPPPYHAAGAMDTRVCSAVWGGGVLIVRYAVTIFVEALRDTQDVHCMARVWVTPVPWHVAVRHHLMPVEMRAAQRTLAWLRWRGAQAAENVRSESGPETPTGAGVRAGAWRLWSELPVEVFELVLQSAWAAHLAPLVLHA